MHEFSPAEAFHAGAFIREELEERGWTQRDLANIMARPISLVQQMIAGQRGITATTAHELAEAFGTSPTLWMGIDAEYQLWTTRNERAEIRKRAQVFEYAPIRDMQRRGWIEKNDKPDRLTATLRRFFHVDSLEHSPGMVANARASVESEDGGLTAAQVAWCYRALQIAKRMQVERFSKTALRSCINDLQMLTNEPEQVRHVPRVLAKAGVRFVVVEHLPRTRIDGAALWLDNKSPVIALSMRYDRIDYFWHTLCHELAHVLNNDGIMIDVDAVDAGKRRPSTHAEVEMRADLAAAAMLVSTDNLNDFIARKKPFYRKPDIIRFARTQKVHPGIVAGQLQYRGEIDYGANREMLVKVRDIIVDASITDGWGHTIKTAW